MRIVLCFMFLVFGCLGCSATIGNIKSWVLSIHNEPLEASVVTHFSKINDIDILNFKGADIRAGYAKVNITPYDSQYLAGYFPTRKSNGIHDELWAKCLALEDEKGERIVIVSCDLIGLLSDDVKAIKFLVSGMIESNRIFITATHTHSAPDTVGLWGGGFFLLSLSDGKNNEYMERIRGGIARGIQMAVDGLRPAKIRFGEIELAGLTRGEPDNDPDEVMRTMWIEFGFSRIILVNFGIHPSAIYSRLITGDIIYFLTENLGNLMGGEVMFVNGAQGGVQPIDGGWENAKSIGEKLALGAVQSLRDLPIISTSSAIIIKQKIIYIPLQNTRFILANKLGMIPDLRNKDGAVEVELNFIKIGPPAGGLEIVTIPGELFPGIWFKIKEKMSGWPTMIWGLTNGLFGYIMSREEYLSGRHSYHASVSVGPEIGEEIEKAFSEMIK